MILRAERRNSSSAFTLIELLVVIAIIAILAAILFPVFAQARAQARKTTCLSNNKQVGLSVLMYSQDYDEGLPLLWTRDWNYNAQDFLPGTPGTSDWHNLVYPYTKNFGMMICPDGNLTDSNVLDSNTGRYDVFVNYGMPPVSKLANVANWNDTYYTTGATIGWQGIGGYYAGNGWATPLVGTGSTPLAQIAEPANQVMACDSTGADWWDGYYSSSGIQNAAFSYCVTFGINNFGTRQFGPFFDHLRSNNTNCGEKNNNGQACTVFTDGHAKAFNQGQFFATKVTSTGQKVYSNLWTVE